MTTNNNNNNINNNHIFENNGRIFQNNHIFENNRVQSLYNILYSEETRNLKTTTEIYNVLFPSIKSVLEDSNAYIEAKQSNEFTCIFDHFEKEEQDFKLLNINESMCVSLWMGVYH